MEVRYESASVSPEVALSRFGSTPEEYERLDRFGRVKSQVWYDGTDVLDQFDYSLDFAGNRTGRDIPAGLTNGFDQLYTYDDLDRLRTYEEGTISTGSISSPVKEAAWTLSGTGNWSTYEEKVSSTTTLDQSRTLNGANEITDITNTTGSAWTDPTHDAAGNMTLAPSPTAPGNSAKDQTYIWDAWNRLVEVKEGETTLATYQYDGLHRRIAKTVGAAETRYYLSEDDQILEERDDQESVLQEHVWHPYYVDAEAARWDNTSESAVYYHALHDANFNVTAVMDGAAATQERYHYTPLRPDDVPRRQLRQSDHRICDCP